MLPMTRTLQFIATLGLLLSSVGCCCLGGGGYGACYPPAAAPCGPCQTGACGYTASAMGPGIAQRDFYSSFPTAQATIPGAISASGPVAIGPIIPGPVSYAVPMTTTTLVTTPITTAALQPLPTY
jgi:hypothetical protein